MLGYDGLVVDAAGVIIPFLRMLLVWGSGGHQVWDLLATSITVRSPVASVATGFVPRPVVEVKGGWGAVDMFLPRVIPREAYAATVSCLRGVQGGPHTNMGYLLRVGHRY